MNKKDPWGKVDSLSIQFPKGLKIFQFLELHRSEVQVTDTSTYF